MTRAVLALGSNIGDRHARLRAAVAAVRGTVVARSVIVQTPPWGPIAQDDYLNAVIIVVDNTASAEDWLAEAVRLERAAGRDRGADAVRWGPRTLDVDVIALFDDSGASITRTDPAFTVPHPRAHERAFVLAPWLDADPLAVLPGRGEVADIISELPQAELATVRACPELSWDGTAGEQRHEMSTSPEQSPGARSCDARPR